MIRGPQVGWTLVYAYGPDDLHQVRRYYARDYGGALDAAKQAAEAHRDRLRENPNNRGGWTVAPLYAY